MVKGGDTAGFDISGAVTTEGRTARTMVHGMAASLVRSGRTAAYELHITGNNGIASFVTTSGLAEYDARPAPSAFQSPNGDSAIVVAGYITNSEELAGSTPANASESQTVRTCRAILEAYQRFGPRSIARLQGSFAIAIWDGQRDQLFLARDRLGVKPLYYWQDGKTFLFSSKLKSLLGSTIVPKVPSDAGTYSYLLYGVVCEPFTAVDGVMALPPAHYAIITNQHVDIRQYWDIFAQRSAVPAGVEEAASNLRTLLECSLSTQLDPYGTQTVFLSGGMDSSTLAALTKHETGRVSTLSIDPVGLVPSDKPFIDLVSKYLASTHVERRLTSDITNDMLNGYFDAMDQPTVDGLNAYVAARHAGDLGFTSALYGVGSDELFGPPWNLSSIINMERLARYPSIITAPAGILLGSVRGQSQGPLVREWMARESKPGAAFDFLSRMYFQREMSRLWIGDPSARDQLGDLNVNSPECYARNYSRLTLHYFLKNQLLRIADWAGTYHAVDIRMPYLHQPVVELALDLSPDLKTGQPKRVLAAAVRDIVPAEVLTRPKLGFGIPLPGWMKSGLQKRVDTSLRQVPDSVKDLIDTREVVDVWSSYLKSGARWRCPWGLFALNEWWRSTG